MKKFFLFSTIMMMMASQPAAAKSKTIRLSLDRKSVV